MITCVIHEAKELKIENCPEPRPQDGEVLVRFGATSNLSIGFQSNYDYRDSGSASLFSVFIGSILYVDLRTSLSGCRSLAEPRLNRQPCGLAAET
jgi:hypothetical protein